MNGIDVNKRNLLLYDVKCEIYLQRNHVDYMSYAQSLIGMPFVWLLQQANRKVYVQEFQSYEYSLRY